MGHAWEHIEHYDNASILNFYYGGGIKAEFGAPRRVAEFAITAPGRDSAKLAIEQASLNCCHQPGRLRAGPLRAQ